MCGYVRLAAPWMERWTLLLGDLLDDVYVIVRSTKEEPAVPIEIGVVERLTRPHDIPNLYPCRHDLVTGLLEALNRESNEQGLVGGCQSLIVELGPVDLEQIERTRR